MSTYQIAIRSTAAFRGFSPARMYERFLNWWVTLYAAAPRKPRPMI